MVEVCLHVRAVSFLSGRLQLTSWWERPILATVRSIACDRGKASRAALFSTFSDWPFKKCDMASSWVSGTSSGSIPCIIKNADEPKQVKTKAMDEEMMDAPGLFGSTQPSDDEEESDIDDGEDVEE